MRSELSLCIDDLPATVCIRIIHHVCLAHQARKFEDPNTTVNTGIAKIITFPTNEGHSCQFLQKRCRAHFIYTMLDVTMNMTYSQRKKLLKFVCRSTYILVTLDHAHSYNAHLPKSGLLGSYNLGRCKQLLRLKRPLHGNLAEFVIREDHRTKTASREPRTRRHTLLVTRAGANEEATIRCIR